MVNKILGLPGTGKTTRLMDYIEEWKREYGLENVCAETFRVEMARELRSRVLDEGVENEDLYWFGTTHGICRRIQEIDLKDIAQEAERKEFCEELGIPYKGGKEPEEIFEPEPEDTLGDQLFSVKTWLTLNLKEPTDWRQAPSAPAVDDEVVISFMEQWEEYKEKKGIYDFDDMLKMEHEDPRSHPPVDGLAVDEFQDKAKIQYEIYAKWKKYIPNVVIAGDPHQCLYDYFGASPEFFFAEEGDLEILGTTWRLLEDNWSYAKATLERVGYDVPELRCRGEGGFVRSIRPNEYPSTVLKLKNESTFHLVRCNYMVREIASTLISLGVPFYTRKGFGGWTKSQVNLYNGILKLRKMRKHLSIFPIFQKIDVPPLSSLEFKAIVDSFPKKSFTKEKKELMKCEGEKPFEELRWELSPLLWEAVASDSPLRYALRSVTRYGERKVTNALRHYGRRIDKILHYVGTIHSVKGGEATNTFLFDNITKKIYNAMWSDPRPEARVFFVGETRERERQFIVKNFFDTLTYPLEF